MPLNPATLTGAILEITDHSVPGHVFPQTQQEVGDRWAAAAKRYFAEMLFPPPNPAAMEAGAAAMAAVFAAPGAGVAQFPLGWSAFAAAMSPLLVPIVATPPPGPPAIPPLPPIGEPNTPAAAIAAAVDLWAKTGIGIIPSVPPIVNPWS